MKHIERYFCSDTLVMPQGRDFGAPGCPGGEQFIFFEHGHMAYRIDGDDEQNKTQIKKNTLESNCCPWVEDKRSNIMKF